MSLCPFITTLVLRATSHGATGPRNDFAESCRSIHISSAAPTSFAALAQYCICSPHSNSIRRFYCLSCITIHVCTQTPLTFLQMRYARTCLKCCATRWTCSRSRRCARSRAPLARSSRAATSRAPAPSPPLRPEPLPLPPPPPRRVPQALRPHVCWARTSTRWRSPPSCGAPLSSASSSACSHSPPSSSLATATELELELRVDTPMRKQTLTPTQTRKLTRARGSQCALMTRSHLPHAGAFTPLSNAQPLPQHSLLSPGLSSTLRLQYV